MNELLRLLGKALRPFGYDVRPHGALNLLPYKGISPDSPVDLVRTVINREENPEQESNVNLEKVIIVFRSCLDDRRLSRAQVRINSIPMIDIIERCLSSLISSVNYAIEKISSPQIEFIILDDHSSKEYEDRIKNIALNLRCRWRFETTLRSGQGASLHQQFLMARDDNALYYFCEDDFLHERSAIYEMWLFYNQIYRSSKSHLVIHPQEHESLYKHLYHPAFIILSPFRHWRSVNDATHVIFTHSFVVKKYWLYFEDVKYVGDYRNRHRGSERRTTNRLADHLPFFAPIPRVGRPSPGNTPVAPIF